MFSNYESTTSQYYVMYGAGAVFFSSSGSGKKVPKSRLRLHNAAGDICHMTKMSANVFSVIIIRNTGRH